MHVHREEITMNPMPVFWADTYFEWWRGRNGKLNLMVDRPSKGYDPGPMSGAEAGSFAYYGENEGESNIANFIERILR